MAVWVNGVGRNQAIASLNISQHLSTSVLSTHQNKSLKSIVNLPSALPPEQENTVQEQEERSYSDWGPDDESQDQEDEACSSQYKTRKERLSKNWEALDEQPYSSPLFNWRALYHRSVSSVTAVKLLRAGAGIAVLPHSIALIVAICCTKQNTITNSQK